jgi:hypothetical protein
MITISQDFQFSKLPLARRAGKLRLCFLAPLEANTE